METKKLLLFLATEKGYTVLQQAVKQNADSIGCVVSFPETNVIKSWHEDIFALCRQNGIRFCLWQDIKNDIEKFVRDGGFYTAVAVSWKYLIPLSINKYMNCGLIVFHDSLLPRYRGFAPTPTAILNGETEIGVTALFATEEVDRGDILLQRKMSVSRDQYMQEIITRQAGLYGEMFCTLMTGLRKGSLTAKKQDERLASYSIWRSPEDCEIDWTKPAEQIYDFIRAVGAPYPGAYTYYMGRRTSFLRCVTPAKYGACATTGRKSFAGPACCASCRRGKRMEKAFILQNCAVK